MNFSGIFLLYPRGGVYGNETRLVRKLGRLLVTWDTVSGVSCYVLNTTDTPISAYNAQKLTELCLSGTKSYKEAFGIQDTCLHEEPNVEFRKGLDGSFVISLKQEPLLIRNSGEFYKGLAKEIRSTWMCSVEEDFITFFDMVSLKSDKSSAADGKVRVLIHSGESAEFDVIINIKTAGSMIGGIMNNWDVFYDMSSPTVGCNPLLLQLPPESVKPLRGK